MRTKMATQLSIDELKAEIAELSACLRHFNRTGVYMAIDQVAFEYLADYLCKMKEELASMESEELIRQCTLIKSN